MPQIILNVPVANSRGCWPSDARCTQWVTLAPLLFTVFVQLLQVGGLLPCHTTKLFAHNPEDPRFKTADGRSPFTFQIRLYFVQHVDMVSQLGSGRRG